MKRFKILAKGVFSAWLLVSTLFAFSQHVLTGKVTDENGKPIPFVSIGIPNSYVGTISELNGEFELKVPANLMEGNLSFSSVGYKSTAISIKESMGVFLDITLLEDVRRLSEVIVASKRIRPKVKRTGNLHLLNGRFMTDPNYSGSAMAQLIISPFDTTQIQWISLGYLNKIKDLQLRVKFHEVTENGRPGELIFNKEIIVDLYEFSGEHKMRFDEFVYVTKKEFFVVMEPLVLKENRVNLVNTIATFLEESPEHIEVKEDGDMIINHNYLDINFFQFTISNKKKVQHIIVPVPSINGMIVKSFPWLLVSQM